MGVQGDWGRLECQLNLQLRKPFKTFVQGLGQSSWIGMLAQFTITKAIHNTRVVDFIYIYGWNVSSIYNYESHSQHWF